MQGDGSILKVTQFQPEFAKVAMISLFQYYYWKPDIIKANMPFLLNCMLPLGLICGLTRRGSHLWVQRWPSPWQPVECFILAALNLTLYPYLGFGLLAVAGLMIAEPGGWIVLMFLGKGGYDYQISQSLLAIGTGGIFGRGLEMENRSICFCRSCRMTLSLRILPKNLVLSDACLFWASMLLLSGEASRLPRIPLPICIPAALCCCWHSRYWLMSAWPRPLSR